MLPRPESNAGAKPSGHVRQGHSECWTFRMAYRQERKRARLCSGRGHVLIHVFSRVRHRKRANSHRKGSFPRSDKRAGKLTHDTVTVNSCWFEDNERGRPEFTGGDQPPAVSGHRPRRISVDLGIPRSRPPLPPRSLQSGLRRVASTIGQERSTQSPPHAHARTGTPAALKGARHHGRRPANTDRNGRAS